ncbi:glycosyltransferase family 4 protein [Patescibacteria group bacterium]
MDNDKKMKILFISRAYPPVIGGIENQNYELSQWLPKYAEVKTIINTRGKKFLPVFFPYATVKAIADARDCDAILLGDGVLASIGWLLKIITKKPVISVVHGLDLTYDLALYQKLWVNFFIPRMDKLIAVGNTTIEEGVKRNIPEEKFVFIPNGVDPESLIGNYSRKDLEKITKLDLQGRKIILTLGRLAKRKGVAWFVENVVPKLDANVMYLIAGDGVDKDNIKKAIVENKLEKRVKLFTNISNGEKKVLYNTADLFVQPNIKIEGDMEGFGLVVLEAASCERVVLVSQLEGLKDAIIPGKNGFLAESGNAEQYLKKINALLSEDELRLNFGKQARKYVKENYSWKNIAKEYMDEIKKNISN